MESIPPNQAVNRSSDWSKLALLVSGALVVGSWLSTQPKRVFVSYDHENDVRFRDMLRAWDKNPQFKFRFDLTSPINAINSDDEAVVKRALTPKLKAAEFLLVLVGDTTERSKWIRWEIERASDEDIALRIGVIKLARGVRMPSILRGRGVACQTGFTMANVSRVLNDATSLSVG